MCGNDWKTYSNRCEMRKEACKTGVGVIPVYNGPCISSLNGKDWIEMLCTNVEVLTNSILL